MKYNKMVCYTSCLSALLIRILCIFSFSFFTADRKCLWLFTPAPSRRRCNRAYPIEASNWMWIYCSPIRTLTTLRRERKIFVNSILMHRIRVSNERKIRVTAGGVVREEGGEGEWQLSSSAVKQMRILMSVAPTGKHTNTHTHKCTKI